MSRPNPTEEKILSAAEEVFHEKGYDGTRMQEVADHAGINKGLLHYYFKTKDALFEAIFSVALNRMIAKVGAVLELEIVLEDKIGLIVDQYIAMLLRNPHLPRFVLNELNKHPEKFISRHISSEANATFSHFEASVKKEIDGNRIRAIDPKQLFMNMMSMLVFPFIGRPLLQVVTGTDKDAYRTLLEERKTHVKSFIMNALKP